MKTGGKNTIVDPHILRNSPLIGLTEFTEIDVRFNEADPLGIVWHGHYIRYFEDGREAFGKKYGLSYMDLYHVGMAVPVVSIQCNYRQPLRYGDRVSIQAIYIPETAAKLRFDYVVSNVKTGKKVAEGSSVQVFVEAKTFQLQLVAPAFFEEWKKKWGVL